MSSVRRLFRCLVFGAVFSFLGGGIFVLVRSQPRCALVEPESVALLSADGDRILTYRTHPARGGIWRVRDTHTGELLHEWIDEFDGEAAYAADGRHFAVIFEDGTLHLYDWQAGERWTFNVPNYNLHNGNPLTFSAQDRWLILPPSTLIDVEERRIVTRELEAGATISGDDRLKLFEKDGQIVVWDLAANKAHGVLPWSTLPRAFSPDGRWIAFGVPDPVSGWTRDVEIWDASSVQRRVHHALPELGDLGTLVFSPNSRRLIIRSTVGNADVMATVLDADTGDLLWSTLASADASGCAFSPDGSLLSLADEASIAMFEVETGKRLWGGAGWGKTHFTRNADLVLYQDNPEEIAKFVDARTGQMRWVSPIWVAKDNLTLTPDGRSFLLRGWKPGRPEPSLWDRWVGKVWPRLADAHKEQVNVCIALDTATLRQRFRADHCGQWSATLSADGTTLATVEPTDETEMYAPRVIRIWDVPATKAWLWALGVTTGAALVWWCAVMPLWRRWRQRRATPLSRSAS